MARRVIVDCDPGHDDALAILLAGRRLEVLAITTVAGNQTVEKVTTNALKVVEAAGLTAIPVARGAATPLVRPPRHAPEVHGETGLDGPELPPPRTPVADRHAVDLIVETAMREDDVTLLALGPLTNVALALRREPRLSQRLREICLMGGSTTRGNVTPAAEFNISVDPEAAHAVFTSGVPVRMVGLNVTQQVVATPERRRAVRAAGTRVAVLAADLLEFYSAVIHRLYGLPGGALHDPVAAAALIDPSLVRFAPMHVAVELHGEHTAGMTVCDDRYTRTAPDVPAARRGAPPNAEVAVAVDADRCFDLLLDVLREYP